MLTVDPVVVKLYLYSVVGDIIPIINKAINQSNFYRADTPGYGVWWVSMEEQPSRWDVFETCLGGCNWGGWTDKQWEVVPKAKGTSVKCPRACVGLDPMDQQSDSFVWSLWAGWEWCSKQGVKINRLFFTKNFVDQQTDLELNSSLLVTNEGNTPVEHCD